MAALRLVTFVVFLQLFKTLAAINYLSMRVTLQGTIESTLAARRPGRPKNCTFHGYAGWSSNGMTMTMILSIVKLMAAEQG